jgi:hypothetical protein
MREAIAMNYPSCSWPRGLEKLIFEASLGVPEPNRELFISAASGDDDLLYSRVLKLLGASHGSTGVSRALS